MIQVPSTIGVTRVTRGPAEKRLLLFVFGLLPFLNFFRALLLTDAVVLIRDLLLLIAICVYGARMLVRRKLPKISNLFLTHLILLWFCLVLLGTYAGLFTSKNVDTFFVFRLARLYCWSILFFFASRWFTKREIIALGNLLCIVAIVVSLYGVFQELHGFTGFEKTYISSPAVGGFSRDPEQFDRIFSTFGSPNIFATFALLLFWLSIGLQSQTRGPERMLLAMPLVLALVDIVISRMRLGLVSLLVAILVYLPLQRRTLKSTLSAMLILMLLGAGVVAVASSGTIIGFLDLPDLAASYNVRVSVLRDALSSLSLYQPLGGGIGASETHPLAIDNSYLVIMIELGWLGFAILSLIILGILLCALITVRKLRDPRWRDLCLPLWLGVLCIFLMGNGSTVFFDSIISPYFWFFAGVLVNARRLESTEP